jgi:thioredoxin 1
MATENVLVLGNDSFDAEVLKSSVPVLVDFWASWCGPCRMVAPIISQLADEYTGKIKVGKVNVDEERELAATYKVMSIPTMVLFKDGKAVDQVIGARPKGDLEKLIKKHI